MSELTVPRADIEELYANGTLDCEAARDLPCHTGLVLVSEGCSALARVKPDKSVQLVRGDREVPVLLLSWAVIWISAGM